MDTETAAKAYRYLTSLAETQFCGMTSNPAYSHLSLAEIQVQAVKLANRELIDRYGVTAIELMEILL